MNSSKRRRKNKIRRAAERQRREARKRGKTPSQSLRHLFNTAAANMPAPPKIPQREYKRIEPSRLFAMAGTAVGLSMRKHLPDTFTADDRRTPPGSRIPVTLPADIAMTDTIRRGMADLNGMTWATLPKDVRKAMDELTYTQFGCFMGFMAARARHLLTPHMHGLGTDGNITAAETACYDFYNLYPVERLNAGFNPQAYAVGLNLISPEKYELAAIVAEQAMDNVYFDHVMRLPNLLKDADMLAMTMDDVRAYAHVVSRHFILNERQQELFSALILVLDGDEADESAEKTPEGKYKMKEKDLDEEFLKLPSRTFDLDTISAKAGLDYAAPVQDRDETVHIETLVDLAEGAQIRDRLIKENPVLIGTAAGIARRLTEKLRTRSRMIWEGAQEEGLLDPARLTAIITDPSLSSVYRREAQALENDTAVTLLVDNSGSMQGDKIKLAYIATLYTAAALERARIPYEVLGFTSGPGKTGAQTGRQDTLRRIVYKEFEDRRLDAESLAGMLCNGMKNGTPTSECLLWAANRLMECPQQRKILLSIEDGMPAVSTLGKTTGFEHLKAVAKAIEQSGEIQLAAIGVMHPVSQFYKNSVRIDRSEQLPMAVSSLLDLLLVQNAYGNPRLLQNLQKNLERTAPKHGLKPDTL